MLHPAKTPDGMLSTLLVDNCTKKDGDLGISPVDRIALAAASSVALFILAIVGVTCESAKQPMPAAAVAAMSSYIGLPASALHRGMSNTPGKD
jgi:hypothetical protein